MREKTGKTVIFTITIAYPVNFVSSLVLMTLVRVTHHTNTFTKVSMFTWPPNLPSHATLFHMNCWARPLMRHWGEVIC